MDQANVIKCILLIASQRDDPLRRDARKDIHPHNRVDMSADHTITQGHRFEELIAETFLVTREHLYIHGGIEAIKRDFIRLASICAVCHNPLTNIENFDVQRSRELTKLFEINRVPRLVQARCLREQEEKAAIPADRAPAYAAPIS